MNGFFISCAQQFKTENTWKRYSKNETTIITPSSRPYFGTFGPPNLVHLDAANGHFTGSSISLPNGELGLFWTQRIKIFS
uniref:Uncharacterized protein n=1 Tax=Globodera rostochiensis TaxID=31243 RepID=A0A914HIM8_GLORO